MAKKNDKGFQPVGNRLLITRKKIDNETTEAGIILPKNHKKKEQLSYRNKNKKDLINQQLKQRKL